MGVKGNRAQGPIFLWGLRARSGERTEGKWEGEGSGDPVSSLGWGEVEENHHFMRKGDSGN